MQLHPGRLTPVTPNAGRSMSRAGSRSGRQSAASLNAQVMNDAIVSKKSAVWAVSDEDEEEDSEELGPQKPKQSSGLPPGLDWLGGIVKPIDDMGKNMGQLFCPFLMPVSQDTMVKEYCEELEKDRLDLASQNQALAQELERLKLSAAKKKRVKGKSELDRFVDLRILLSNLREGRLSEEETCLRTCWAAWDGRDRPLKEAIAARASSKSSGRSSSESGPPSPPGSVRSRSSSRAGSLRGEMTGTSSSTLSLAQLETNAQKANACAEWIVTMMQVKQVAPESTSVDEIGPLLGLMYSFPKEEKVQACGAEALALIAVDESENSRLAPEDLVEEGAITVLLTAMKTHRTNASLQEQAGSALLHMASRSGDVAVEIRQAGGQKAIAAAIKLHPQLKYLRTYLDELLQEISPNKR